MFTLAIGPYLVTILSAAMSPAEISKNMDVSHLMLSPLGQLPTVDDRALDLEKLSTEIARQARVALVHQEATADALVITGPDAEIRVYDNGNDIIFSSRQSNAADKIFTNMPKITMEETEARAADVLGAADVDLSQAVIDVHDYAITGGYEGQPKTTTIIGRKAFVYRYIGGVEVAGNKLVLTFALDGRLQKVVGTWSRVRYSNSILKSRLTTHQVRNRAADYLVNHDLLNEENRLAGAVGSHFIVTPTGSLKLMGFVNVQTIFSGQPGRVESYDFEI